MTDRQLRIVFYSLWLALMLAQAWRVELQGDEAYYWRWSLEPAWGYFDHPPVTAWLARLGYELIPTELGVRLGFVLMITGTVWLLEKMIRPSNLKLFYLAISSVAFLQLGLVFGGGMYALPDFPLLFFTALFFYVFLKFLESPDYKSSFVLSLVISLLLLSKYHGVLVVGFAFLANISLLRTRYFWLVVILSILFFSPHLVWQVDHDFIPVKFHLFERNTREYSIRFLFEYLASQPFVLGPLVSPLLLWASFRYRDSGDFSKALLWTMAGTYGFFLLMAMRGRVEANWTVMALVPMVVLGYPVIESNDQLTRWLRYAAYVSVSLLMGIRIVLITQWLPESIADSRMFGARVWTKELFEKSNGLLVAFMNSYQRAAQYEFYTGVPAFSLNNIYGRNNQYTLWDTEARYQGQTVVLVSNYPRPELESIRMGGEDAPWQVIDRLYTASNLRFLTNLPDIVSVTPKDTLNAALHIRFINENIRDLEADPEHPMTVIYSYMQPYLKIDARNTGLILDNAWMKSGEAKQVQLIAPAEPGTYALRFSCGSDYYPAGINSERITVIVE